MTGTHVLTSLTNHINTDKAKFIKKMQEHILKIDDQLNIKIDYSITETANSVIVTGVNTYSYFSSKWFHSAIDPNVRMVFNSHSNPYLRSDTSKSLLSISLNDNFDIVNVLLKNWVKKADGGYTDVTLNFDTDLICESGVISP